MGELALKDYCFDVEAQWQMAKAIQKREQICCGHHEDVEKYLQSCRIVDEIDYVLKGLNVVPIEKALNPLKPKDFVKLEARTIKNLRRAASKANKSTITELKSLIKGVDPTSPQSIEEFVLRSADVLDSLPKEVADQVGPVLEDSVTGMYKRTKRNQINRLFRKGKIRTKDALERFGTRDEQVVEMLNRNNKIFINEGIEYSTTDFQTKSMDILNEALAEGVPREEVAKRLNEAVGTTVDNKHYWNIVGSSYTNRSRNWANLETFTEAGFERYQILAIIDERTSQVCRDLDGKVFTIKKQIKILEKQTQVTDLDAFKKKTPWLTTRQSPDGEVIVGIKRPRSFVPVTVDGKLTDSADTLQKLGFAMPPFHGLCRTTVIEAA